MPRCLVQQNHHGSSEVRRCTSNIDVTGTVKFLQVICGWWKVVNVKRKGLDQRLNDPLHAVISDANDPKLLYIEKVGKINKFI